MRDLNSLRRTRPAQVTTVVPKITETVVISRTRETRTTDVGTRPGDWSWEELRDYVVRWIETHHGEFPKDPVRIASTFKAFKRRHGEMAGPIAVTAMELHHGMWMGSPISVNRFCEKSDKIFAHPIKESLLKRD
jgi:hypothetical protein